MSIRWTCCKRVDVFRCSSTVETSTSSGVLTAGPPWPILAPVHSMMNDTGTSWRPLGLLAIVLAIVMFILPFSFRFPLLDPDEGLHASIAQEMIEHDQWIAPSFLGRPFLDKPILYFWAQVVSLRLFGFSEAAVRLPGLMFGLLGALTTGLLGWRMFGCTTGLIAGSLYATTILPTAMAQAASHDVALVPWVNLTLLLLWESERAAKGRTIAAWTLGAGLFLGLSILTKGLMGVAVAGLAYGGYLLVAWRLRPMTVLRGMAMLLVAVAVAAPWFLAVESQTPGYCRYFFLDRHLLGFATGTQPHGNQPWWYYLPILLGGGLPWIGYLPTVARDAMARRKLGGESPGAGDLDKRATGNTPMPLLWCWLIGWTAFLTVSHSKLATYLWPAFPPIAILAAVAWARWIEGALSAAARQSFKRTFVWSSWSGPLMLPAVVLAVQWTCAVRFGWPVWMATCLAAAIAPLPLIPWRVGLRQAGLAAATLSMAAQFVVVMTMVFPPIAETFSARDLAEHFNRLGQVPPRLFVAEERIGSFVFYLEPRIRARLKKGQLRQLTARQSQMLLAGDVIALPKNKMSRVAEYLDLDGASYDPVGRYRLYRITENAVGRGAALPQPFQAER